MKTTTTSASALATAPVGPSLVEDAYGALAASFEQFCLMGVDSGRGQDRIKRHFGGTA